MSTSRASRAHDVEGALEEQGVAAHPRRRQAHELHRLDRRDACARAERLEQPGHDVHLNAAAPAVAVRAAASGVRSRPRTRTRRGRSRAARRASGARSAPREHRHVGHFVPEPGRRGVDEADERDPVLRMLERACGPRAARSRSVPTISARWTRSPRRRTIMRAADLATAIEHDRECPEDDPLPEVGAWRHR